MTLLLGTVCFVVAVVLWVGALLALRTAGERPVTGETDRQWNTALRNMAFAAPGFAYVQPLGDVRLLSDEELCQAWRTSYAAVSTARSARQLRVAAEDRRSYLEELERRYPLSVSVWLSGNATAEGDPLPFINQGFDDRSPDW